MINKLLILLLILSFSCQKTDDPINPKPPGGDPDPVDEMQEDIAELDKLISDYMTKFSLPGVTLAISKNEKLVYVKGYGLADKEKNVSVTPEHVFRIASCSKAYTGMAIMKLVEEGKLKLTDKVFGSGAVMGAKYGSKEYSQSLKEISVSHLLLNTSGTFVNAQKRDLINTREDLNNQEYLSWVLDNSVMEFEPGSAYHYVNVNFFIAAMIVEEVSGKPFYDYLKEKILTPIGDDITKLALNQADLPNEVKYYGQGNLTNSIYNFNIERYIGSGNVVTNAKSLLKFATALDGKTSRSDLLSSALMSEFTAVTPHSPNWAHGLGVWGQKLYMYGSLPSTRAGWIIDRNTGLAAAIISNSNADYTNPTLDQEIVYAQQDLLVNLVSTQRNFKSIDQF